MDGEHWLALPGELEVRKRGSFYSLGGRFPYSSGRAGSTRGTATTRDRGRVRKERMGPDALGWQVHEFQRVQGEIANAIGDAIKTEALRQELERRNVHVLVGHDFNKPLGSMLGGSAVIKSDARALTFEVDLPELERMPSYMVDTVRQVEAGLIGGVSPGFRVPPRSAVPNAEELVDEPGNPGVQIRQINQAVLYEISLVTRPAYTSTDVELDRRAQAEANREARPRVWL